MRILLIEDDETIGEAVRVHLAANGDDVLWVVTLAAARESLATRPVDIIVLDLQLPDGDGLTFLQFLRMQGHSTPLVVISAISDVKRRLDCLKGGADDYLAKPFHLKELALRLQRLVREPRDIVVPQLGRPEEKPMTSPKAIAETAVVKSGPWTRFRAFIRAHRTMLSLPLLAAGTLGIYLAYLQISGNFHTVIEGELYRSAQPTPAQLEAYVTEHGIRTVVNLRGPSEAGWYKNEIAASHSLNVRHIDFGMTSSEELTPQRADEIVAILKNAPKPILIHCKAGADRTGLVSLLYSTRIAGLPEESSEWQLSWLYGHIGVPVLSSTFAMDQSWERLERYYGISHVTTNAGVSAGKTRLL